MYVTIPPEKQGHKLQPRAWTGHYITCESEAVYLVYDPAEDVVKRTPPSRVAEREGVEDVHDHASYRDRYPDWDQPTASGASEIQSTPGDNILDIDGVPGSAPNDTQGIDTIVNPNLITPIIDGETGERNFDDGASDFNVPLSQLIDDLILP